METLSANYRNPHHSHRTADRLARTPIDTPSWPPPIREQALATSSRRRILFASFDLAEGVVREDLEFEPELAHPPRHDTAVDVDMVAQEDRLLAMERQSVAIFGNRDIGEQRCCRNAAFNDLDRRRCLGNPVFIFEGILRPMRAD